MYFSQIKYYCADLEFLGILGQVRFFTLIQVFIYFFLSIGLLSTLISRILISRGLKGFWIIEKKTAVMLEKLNIPKEMLLSDLHPKVI
jgi:hypothetical protein